jgi:hypothetical protein
MDLGEIALITGDYPIGHYTLDLVNGLLQLPRVEYPVLLGHERPFSSKSLPIITQKSTPSNALLSSLWG